MAAPPEWGPPATSAHVSHFSKVVKGQQDKLLCQDSRVASGKHKLMSKPNANHMCQLPGDKDVGLKGLKDSYLELSSKGLRSTQTSGVSFIWCPFLGLSSFTYLVGGSHVIGTFQKRIPGHFSFGKEGNGTRELLGLLLVQTLGWRVNVKSHWSGDVLVMSTFCGRGPILCLS